MISVNIRLVMSIEGVNQSTFAKLALLELVQPMGFSAHIQPSCVSSEEEDLSLVPEYGTVSGWGWTQENQADGERADVLRKARVKIWNNEVCEHSYRSQGKSNSITDTQMCAGYENGQIDSCWVSMRLKSGSQNVMLCCTLLRLTLVAH